MKVGILTYHSSDNYGAFLQSYALANALEERTGYDVEIIDYTMARAVKMNKKMINFNRRQIESWIFNYWKYKMFIKSRKKFLPLSKELLVTDDLDLFAEYVKRQSYNIVIVGSDEVWKLDGFRGFPNPYWLPKVTGVYKVAYAVSARNLKEDLDEKIISKVEKLSADFSYIGVRDSVTRELMAGCVSKTVSIHMNCDPTFAYDFKPDKETGEKILREKFHIKKNKKCIGLMCGVPELANNIIKEYNQDVQIISLYYYYRGSNGFAVLTPFEWMHVIAALDGLITTFFHGMVFAIKNDTRFLVIENRQVKDASSSKNYDLLKRNDLEEHYVSIFDKETLNRKLSDFIKEICKGETACDFSQTRVSEKKMFESFLMSFKNIRQVNKGEIEWDEKQN